MSKLRSSKSTLRLAEIDDWIDDEEPLTVHEKAVLDARLTAYVKDPDAGSTWEAVEDRIRAHLTRTAYLLESSEE